MPQPSVIRRPVHVALGCARALAGRVGCGAVGAGRAGCFTGGVRGRMWRAPPRAGEEKGEIEAERGGR